jgi:hypothetical protein
VIPKYNMLHKMKELPLLGIAGERGTKKIFNANNLAFSKYSRLPITH